MARTIAAVKNLYPCREFALCIVSALKEHIQQLDHACEVMSYLFALAAAAGQHAVHALELGPTVSGGIV